MIVGAGAAGCVVTNRLSEDPSTSVLLLKAGGRNWSPLIQHNELSKAFVRAAQELGPTYNPDFGLPWPRRTTACSRVPGSWS